MENQWRNAMAGLTRGADLWKVSLKSCALASIATVLIIPYFHSLLFHIQRQFPIRATAFPWDLLYSQSALFFIICLLSSMVGYGFMERYALPGFGRIGKWRRSLPFLLATGLFLMLISCLLSDSGFSRTAPALWPKREAVYLLTMPLNSMITDETILRFGFVTIAVGLCRNKPAGVALAALFAAMLTEKYFIFIGVPAAPEYLSAVRFVFSFGINFILGWLFITRGLLSSMTVNFVLGLHYPVTALMTG